MFTVDGSGSIVGCYPTWPEFLTDWLQVNLCVGEAPPDDARVLDFLLKQHIVTERDLATVATRVHDAATWTVDSVLTHYDNRANLMINISAVTMLDWDLSCGYRHPPGDDQAFRVGAGKHGQPSDGRIPARHHQICVSSGFLTGHS